MKKGLLISREVQNKLNPPILYIFTFFIPLAGFYPIKFILKVFIYQILTVKAQAQLGIQH
jgi:hypothetical protein